MSILDLLRSDGSIVVNKSLAHRIGLNETIVLSELISLFLYYRGKDCLDDEGYFYCTVNTLEEHTTLQKDAQNRAIVKLADLGLIHSVKKGLPAKRHITIDEAAIAAFILSADKTAKKSPTDNDAENRHEKAEKPRQNQSAKKSPTRERKNRELEGEKTAINNTYVYNTDLEEEEETTTGLRAMILQDIREVREKYPEYETVVDDVVAAAVRDMRPIFAEEIQFLECAADIQVHPETLFKIYQRVRGELDRTARVPYAAELIQGVFDKFDIAVTYGRIGIDAAAWFLTTWTNDRINLQQHEMRKSRPK